MIRYSIIEVNICLLSVCFNGDPTNVPRYPKYLQKHHGSAYISWYFAGIWNQLKERTWVSTGKSSRWSWNIRTHATWHVESD